jgi:cytoskeletal protein CcmA (bactofilin family)
MGDAVRVTCNSVTVTGEIDGDLIALCGTVLIEKEAHITGSVDAKGANVEVHGIVDGDLDATSGEIALSGKVGGDATLKADVINVDPGARIDGDLEYTSRDRVDFNKDNVVHGEVSYTPEKKHPPVSRHGFMKWFFFTATAFLASLGALAIFRKSAPAIVASVGGDALRSAGIGFITAIVVPVAAALSCILIITIPAVILVLLAYCLLLYLAQAPVALWLGEQVLRRMNRSTASPFVALSVGTPLMYAVFSIPYLGKLALFAVIFTGFGAIVITIWTARQVRRGGAVPAAPGMPPAQVQA